MNILAYKNIKSILFFILTALFAYTSAEAVIKILDERSLGSIFRHFLPTTPYFFLIVLINLYDIRRISFSGFFTYMLPKMEPRLILKKLILILLLAIPAGLFVLTYFAKGGLLIGSVVILVFMSLFISCIFMVSEKQMFGIITYIIATPFLFFIQRNLGLMGIKNLAISGITIPLSVIYLFLISICFFFTQYLRQGSEISKEEKKIIRLCLLFVFFPLICIIFSKDPSHSFIYYILDLFLPITFFFILLRSIRTLEDIKKLILALILSIFLYEFFAVYFMYKLGTIKDITIQLHGSEIHTGHKAVFFPLIIPFQVAMYELLKGWKRILMGFMVLFFIVFLFLSNYRTSFVAFGTGFMVFYFFCYRIRLWKKLLSTIIVLLCFTIFVLYTGNVTKKLGFFRIIQSYQQFSQGESIVAISSGRIEIWRAALKIISDYPLLGIGPDMWSQYIPQYSLPIFPYKDPSGKVSWVYAYDPHNLYMLVWINYGVFIFISYVILLYIVTMKALRNVKDSYSNLMRNISVGAFISFMTWIIMSFLTMRFFNHSVLLFALIFWSIIAIIIKLSEVNSVLEERIVCQTNSWSPYGLRYR